MTRKPARPRHGTVVAYLALFVALSGTSYAAVTLSRNDVRSKHIGKGQVKKRDIGKNAVNSRRVKDGTLLSRDFKPGQLVAGAPGPQGPAGAHGIKGDTGPKGDTGTVDTSNFYDKADSDGRFLAAAGKAIDADLLDGRNSSEFVRLVGQVAADGTVLTGTGFTSSRTALGNYTVSFPSGTFSGCKPPMPVVTARAAATIAAIGTLSCSFDGAASFDVTMRTHAGAAVDARFFFMAV